MESFHPSLAPPVWTVRSQQQKEVQNEHQKICRESASAPDWQDPSRPRSVSPLNRLKTTWGEIKKRDKR